jgi:hypothetical protein
MAHKNGLGNSRRHWILGKFHENEVVLGGLPYVKRAFSRNPLCLAHCVSGLTVNSLGTLTDSDYFRDHVPFLWNSPSAYRFF